MQPIVVENYYGYWSIDWELRSRNALTSLLCMQHLLSAASSWVPETIVWMPEAIFESAWIEHAPFAFWLMDAHRPSMLVELGTHYGYSYFAFNQALKKLRVKCRCFAIDTWVGDEHAGYYSDHVFESVRKLNDEQFADFSELLRMTFDEAVSRFEDGSIDLLHIDGRHFYEDVKHDFETWLPKLSKRALVLLHDTNVRVRDFGVYRLWEELKQQYPHFEFLNEHGLGVLGVGKEIPSAICDLFAASGDENQAEMVRQIYGRLGSAVVDRARLHRGFVEANTQLKTSCEDLQQRYTDSERARAQSVQMYASLQEEHEKLKSWLQDSEQKHARYEQLLSKCAEFKRLYENLSETHTQLKASYEDLQQRHTSLLNQSSGRENLLQQLQTALKQTQEELEKANAGKNYLEARMADYEATCHTLHKELTKHSGDLNAIVHSASWRFTQPLRAIGQHIPPVTRSITYKALQLKLRDALLLRHSWNLLSASPLFDKQFYLDNNPDVARPGQDVILHYLLHGGFEGRDPHPLFHSAWYLQQNADVLRAGVNPLVHFLRQGALEQRSPCPVFDSAYYLANNPDVKAAAVNPLLHYLEKGATEGRNPSADFDTRWYVSQNPHLFSSGLNPLVHYIRWGRFEGWLPRPSLSVSEQTAPHVETDTMHVNGSSPTRDASLAASRQQQKTRIVFISGEPHTPGHKYRVEDLATALPPVLFDTAIIKDFELDKRASEAAGASILWIWRISWSDSLASAIAHAKQSGAQIIFDVDDLMFRPELARSDVIDGIRSMNLTEDYVRDFYASIRTVLEHADHCTAPTSTLARELRDFKKPATVIPNGFDAKTLIKSRRVVWERKQRTLQGRDEIVRIGYAAGSRTHQRDLAIASKAIAQVLNECPNTRLVLFRGPIQLEEFPELMACEHQIEWRDLVPVSELQNEYARFDINIAPLEIGNRFCEAKSELKYFEAALVGVPTIASPTQPFARAIRAGETGFLAANHDEWVASLSQLVQDSVLRASIALNAYYDVLWLYGPERRMLLVTKLVNQLLAPINIRSQLFSLQTHCDNTLALPQVEASEYDTLYESERRGVSRVSVVIPVFNYSHYLPEALESVRAQTVRDIDVIVVDDQSTDNSVSVAEQWLRQHSQDFNFVALLQNRKNAKLGRSRNTGIRFADTEFYLPLDPDNLLLPDCIEKSLQYLDHTGAAFAYPTIEIFGDATGIMGVTEFDPALLQCGNYIDAMAMVRKACWIAVGGYSALEPVGWEDYDFWCKLTEQGFFGVRVKEVIAKYRVHGTSMLHTVTDLPENKPLVISDLNRRHPWLGLRMLKNDGAALNGSMNGHRSAVDLDQLLPLLRCPETGEQLLKIDDNLLKTLSGRRTWPIVRGRPVFTPEGTGVKIHPDTHLSNKIPPEALRMIEQSSGLVLNLSAGGTAVRYPNVVELEYSIFRHTHLTGDVHQLPFQDEIFEAVICLNAFEHYRDPNAAMNEINRVLKPGGQLFIHTAFLQPLHEAPHHYYNCTESGLREWLRNFDVKEVCVSDNFNPAYSISWLASELEQAFEQHVSGTAAQKFREARLGDIGQFWRNPESRNSPLWKLFYELPSDVQGQCAAGWQAIASKQTITLPDSEESQGADAIRTV